MSNANRAGFTLVIAAVALLATSGTGTVAQSSSYMLAGGWPTLPDGIVWGDVISVDPHPNGESMYAFHRAEPPILLFDASGKLLKSWGDRMFVRPHGFHVDREGNIWVTDQAGEGGKGHQVFKFNPDGDVQMALGTPGVAGEGPDTFNGPTDVAIAENGDIFVTDGHGNNRVVKFSKDGTFIKAWGTKGTGPGEFDLPHTVAIDSRGRLFVGDRSNQRIQIFDQEGRFLDQWDQFGMPSGIYIDEDDTIYVADFQLKKALLIGSARDGSVRETIDGVLAEGIAVDAHGNVFAGEVAGQVMTKFAKK